MNRKTVSFAALLLLVTAASGCVSLTSWTHNKRHLKQVWNEAAAVHEDIDRIIFGLERNPAE